MKKPAIPKQGGLDESPRTSTVAVTILEALGGVLATFVLIADWLATRLMGRAAAFRATSEAIAMVPGPLGIVLRRHVYRATLAECGSGLSVGFGTVLTYPDTAIGDGVYIGRFCAVALTTIGSGTMIGDHVRVISGRHGVEPGREMRDQPISVNRVTIGRNAWVASGATILTQVGSEAVVAAGAVVTRAIPEGAIVGGVPAKLLRWRDEGDNGLSQR